MKIYTYSQGCTQAGSVCKNTDRYTRMCECGASETGEPVDDCPECGGTGDIVDSDDLVLHEGTEAELIASARETIRLVHAGNWGAGDCLYNLHEARAILAELDAPAPEEECDNA